MHDLIQNKTKQTNLALFKGLPWTNLPFYKCKIKMKMSMFNLQMHHIVNVSFYKCKINFMINVKKLAYLFAIAKCKMKNAKSIS
jgi:hypothetical protein